MQPRKPFTDSFLASKQRPLAEGLFRSVDAESLKEEVYFTVYRATLKAVEAKNSRLKFAVYWGMQYDA